MNSFSIPKIARILAIFTITLFVLGSCKKKENTVGSGFLDGEKFGSGIYRSTKLLAYTTEKDSIITSRSKVNLVGAYQDPILGLIKSSFGIHIALSEEDPKFGTDPIVDSVVLTMPYLGRLIGDSIKELDFDTDLIYGDKNTPINMKISRLSKFLDPEETYYSTVNLPTLDVLYDGELNFNRDSITLYGHDIDGSISDTSRISPAFRVQLEPSFFQDEILGKQGSSELFTNLNFIKNHINGLVFETSSTDGAVYTFDMFRRTSLIIYYKNDDKEINGDPLPQQQFELKFSTKLMRVNKYDFDDRNSAEQSLKDQLKPNYDTTLGANFIYLQGLSGLEANIKLFTDDIQLDTLRKKNWLINRAELVYRVSDDNENVVAPPYRLLMANRDSLNVPGSDFRMIDYVLDSTAFDGFLRSDATILRSAEKRYYKFRITNYISAILDGEIQYDEGGNVILDENNEPVVKYDDASNYVIKLISFAGNESVSRAKIVGSLKTDESLKNPALFLEIYYSKKD